MVGLVGIVVFFTSLAWLASEFQPRRIVRIGLGVASLAMSFGVAWIAGSVAGSFQIWNANAWYGAASKDLIENTIAELENGNVDQVVAELRVLNSKLEPGYETKADYDKLVAAYAYAISDSPSLHERNDPRWADDVPPSHQQWAAEKKAEQKHAREDGLHGCGSGESFVRPPFCHY